MQDTPEEQWIQGWQDLDTLSYKNREFNPYIDAFWKWFPEAYKHLKHYRITGGEPLMSKETFRSMDWLINNPNPDLEFSINSNFSVPDKLWDKFVEKLEQMKQGNKVKKITIYTSVEGWGARAEYARYGLDFELFKKRYEQIVAMGNVRCVIMAAFNIFSVTSFQQVLEWVWEMKRKYNPSKSQTHNETKTGFPLMYPSLIERAEKSPDHHILVGIDIPYLRHPSALDAQNVTHELFEEYMLPMIDYMADNVASDIWLDHAGFERYEVEKLKRIVLHKMHFNMKNDPDANNHYHILTERAKFYEYVNELDKRRGTNFLEVFPEMTDFYNTCKKSKEALIIRQA
jgi:hypothetical protein